MADTPLGQAAIAAEAAGNISKGIADKAAPKAPIPASTQQGTPEAVDPNAGKEKYVVDGKEYYLSPEQAKAYVQKGISFEPKLSNMGRLQQETAALLDTLAKDPAKVIYNEKFGQPEEILSKVLNSTKVSDKVKETLAKWYYDNVVVPEGMSPEQRESADLKRRVGEYEAAQKQQEEQRLSAENDARVTKALNEIKAGISEALKEAGVPTDSRIAPQLAKRVAQVMQLGFVSGKVITPKEAMAKVRQEINEYQKAYFDVLDDDKLVEQIGKENAEKVRKFYLKQAKVGDKKQSVNPLAPAQKRDERKTMNSDDFREYLQKLKEGK